MNFMSRIVMVLLLLGASLTLGCGDDDDSINDSGPDTDSDTDTDTDTDTDSDSDTDTDTDTDSVCEPTEPPDETCDGVDNDCDGTTDNVPTLGDACTGGLGECEAQGVLICNTISEELECDATIGTPVVEICDDLDNDCDGTTDNVDTLGDACTVGLGECEATGSNICDTTSNTVVCSATAGSGSTEICDNLDNDCDGTTDNVVDLGNSCTVGDGECEATGLYICNFTTTSVECDAVVGTPDTEICDGLDNDCDGTTDNVSGLGAPCTEGLGECEAAGLMVCNTTFQDLECDAMPGTPVAESCDMLDNDCNGYVDDDLFDDDDNGPIPAGAPSATSGTSTFTVTVGSGIIEDVNVYLDISHTWDEDLDVSLESPSGTVVELFSDVGSGEDDFTQTILDDEATTDITAGSAPFTGSFVPENPLSTFDGEDAAGTWTLTITDDSSGDHGTLNDWALEVHTDGSPCQPGGVATDDGETYYKLTVDDQSVIMDLNVALEMTHPMLSDLTVYLISPAGTQVELFSGIGGTGADLTGTILDDEGATVITAGTAPFTGSFIPENLLSAFDGEQLQGDWYLRVVDNVAGNEGEVLSWSIDIPCFAMEAGTTCAQILATDPGATDGLYCLDPSDSEDWFQAYCDMTTDGGGWMIVNAITGADGEQPLVSNTHVAGDPLSFEHYNLNRAHKMTISAVATESIFVRDDSTWLQADAPLFDQNLDTADQHTDIAVNLEADDGTTGSGYMGYANFNHSGGGDYYVASGSADHHSSSYYHLNSGCAYSYLYSYSYSAADYDAGYDVNTSLGSWSATTGCSSGEGGYLAFYSAMR